MFEALNITRNRVKSGGALPSFTPQHEKLRGQNAPRCSFSNGGGSNVRLSEKRMLLLALQGHPSSMLLTYKKIFLKRGLPFKKRHFLTKG